MYMLKSCWRHEKIILTILGSLKITEEDILKETRIIKIASSNILRVQILAILVILKSIVLNPE